MGGVARPQLARAGEEEATELRCAGYYRARCAQSALEGRYRLLDWLAWADLEIDNIRAVLRRCLNRGDAAVGLHLSASLGWYWITRATTEGIRWLDEFLAAGHATDADPQVMGWAHFMRGFLAVLKADPAAVQIMLLNLGSAALLDGDLGQARPLLTEALRIAQQIDDRVAQFYLFAALGCHAAQAGQARLAARLIAAADAERTGAGANV